MKTNCCNAREHSVPEFFHFIFICHGGVSGDLFKIYLYIYKIKLGDDLFNFNVGRDLFKI